jgi:spore coat polysaccharide biosynthesis protein SpsF
VKVVAIIQARMSSRRLPGKVLADLGGAPMLGRVVDRARAARRIDEVWVACTDRRVDDLIESYCRDAGVSLFRGSEGDVLDRFVGTMDQARGEVAVRLTADCPLLDPAVIDRVVDELVTNQPGTDYVANVLERSFPRGLDVEAFTRGALNRMDRLGTGPEAREHVTIPVRREHQAAFAVRNVRSDSDDSDLRWTVDTEDDLGFVRLIYRTLGLADRSLPYQDLVRWCRANDGWIRRDDPGRTWDPGRVDTGAPRARKTA